MKFHSIEEAIEDFAKGKIIIMVDDEDRENEGDFVMAAEKVSPEAINFMATHGRGIICTPITSQRARELDLPLMIKSNSAVHHTAFTVSVDSVLCGTGVSALDRYLTVKSIVDSTTKPEQLLRPGHIFPLIAKDGGVFERPGHTEASIEMSRLAKLHESAVICEIMNEDGTMARGEELFVIAEKFDLKIITIEDLKAYMLNLKASTDLKITETINMPTKYGNFDLHLFESHITGEHHLAIKSKMLDPNKTVDVRVHYECMTGDVFKSKRCDCGEQLDNFLKYMGEHPNTALLYLRQEGRGIGLPNKIKAYKLQENGFDTITANHQLGFDAEMRNFNFGPQMLKELGITKVNIHTNNPLKVNALKAEGIEVVERVPLVTIPHDENLKYLKVKEEKFGHFLGLIQ